MQATTQTKISPVNWISLIVTMVVFASGFFGWIGAAGGFGRAVEQQAAIPGIAYCSDVCVPTDLNGTEIPMHDGQFVTTGIFDGNFGGEAVWSPGADSCVTTGVLTLAEVEEGARLCINAENVYLDLRPLWWFWKLDPMLTSGMKCTDIQHPEVGHCLKVDLTKDLQVSVQIDAKHYGPEAEG